MCTSYNMSGPLLRKVPWELKSTSISVAPRGWDTTAHRSRWHKSPHCLVTEIPYIHRVCVQHFIG